MKKLYLLLLACAVSFASYAQTFVRATSVAAGDTIIIVNHAVLKAMGPDAGNYRNPVAIEIKDNKIVLTSISTVAQFVVEATGKTAEFYLKDNNGYIYAPDGSNYVKTKKEAAGSWSITINANDSDVIVDKSLTSSSARNVLRYNAQNPRFSCYASTSTVKGATTVYKKVAGSVAPTEELEVNTIAEVIAMEDNTTCTIAGTVVAEYARGYIVKDATAAILVYIADYDKALNIGDVVSITATKSTYNKSAQLISPTTKVTGTASVNHGTPTVINSSNALTLKNSTQITIQYVEAVGTLAVSGSYYNVIIPEVADTVCQLSIAYPLDDYSALDKATIKVQGYFMNISSSKYLNIMATSVTSATAVPVVNADNSAVYVQNGRLMVKTQVGNSIEVFNVLGAKVAQTEATDTLTEMVGLQGGQMLIVRVNGQSHKIRF